MRSIHKKIMFRSFSNTSSALFWQVTGLKCEYGNLCVIPGAHKRPFCIQSNFQTKCCRQTLNLTIKKNLVCISVVLEILSAFTLPEIVPICNVQLSLIHCHATKGLVEQAQCADERKL